MVLYKYLPPERLDVLTQRQIRFTQPAAFNDPFEAKPYLAEFDSSDDFFEREIDSMLQNEVDKLYASLDPGIRAQLSLETTLEIATQLREAQRGQFSQYANQYIPELRTTMQRVFDEQVGILSLSEEPFSLLMWGHYAKSHTGFLIGFDSGNPYFSQKRNDGDEFGHLRQVEYRKTRPNAPFTKIDGADVFLAKAVDWSYEKEWRMLRPIADAQKTIDTDGIPICLFSFPSECIKELILGARINPQVEAAILDRWRSEPALSHVLLRKAVLSETEFKIDAAEIAI